jgi:hypothetical protein
MMIIVSRTKFGANFDLTDARKEVLGASLLERNGNASGRWESHLISHG